MTARDPGDGFDVRRSDVLVVGAGVAGLSCALAAAPLKVALLTKTPFADGGNSVWAQGGIAAAMGEGDSAALHARDTLAAGSQLCDPRAVDRLAQAASAHIGRLVAVGTRFDRGADGRLALGREAAHSRPRILHANGDATGAEIVRALSAAVRTAAHVSIEDEVVVEDLLTENGRVVGAWTRNGHGRVACHRADAVVLATGGAGQLFQFTTNPPEATGDGLVLAARAGAVLADLEFVQFHPTALQVDADPLPLVTEALRGAGATLVDERGHRFMIDVHPDAELAPRDIVARAAWAHAAAGHRVLLDAREAVGDAFPSRFPTVFEACRKHHLDPRTQPIPVTPAAHYHMGGVWVDAKGRSSASGLWACGEVACTGVHGANRLASNSLLEALVFGAGVAEDVRAATAGRAGRGSHAVGAQVPRVDPRNPTASVDPRDARARIRQVMWNHVGLVRSAAGLSAAVADLENLEGAGPSRGIRNLALLGRLIATAALWREESRGGHYRSDAPRARDEWRRRSFLRLDADGRIEVLSESPSSVAGPRRRAAVAAGSAA